MDVTPAKFLEKTSALEAIEMPKVGFLNGEYTQSIDDVSTQFRKLLSFNLKRSLVIKYALHTNDIFTVIVGNYK